MGSDVPAVGSDVPENLVQRVPMQVVLSARRPLAQFTAEDTAADLGPKFHVRKHPTSLLKPENRLLERIKGKALRFLTADRSPPGATFFDRRLQRIVDYPKRWPQGPSSGTSSSNTHALVNTRHRSNNELNRVA